VEKHVACLQSRRQDTHARYTIFDLINGLVPENVKLQDLPGWADIERALREAMRAADEDPIEARLQQLLASAPAPSRVSLDNPLEL
jgi:hypothetical protein